MEICDLIAHTHTCVCVCVCVCVSVRERERDLSVKAASSVELCVCEIKRTALQLGLKKTPSLHIPHSTPCHYLSPSPPLFILIIFLIPLLIHLLLPLLFLFHFFSFSSRTPRSTFPSPYSPSCHPPLYFSSSSSSILSSPFFPLLLPFSCYSHRTPMYTPFQNQI